ncbi:MAG: flagellar protein FlgN [Deltaproteobacteria bacterium]|nr:flagellar protein FlgN [Deltaproteobacteria bacterium]
MLIAQHLKKEISLYKEFITVLQTETEKIIGRDYKGLYETVGLKEHLIIRIESAGRSRLQLMCEAASSLGVQGEPTLSSIIERAAGKVKEELRECQSTILSLLESIREINKLNSMVVRESLDNINKTLGFLGNFMPSTVYNPAGAFEGNCSFKGSRLSEGA